MKRIYIFLVAIMVFAIHGWTTPVDLKKAQSIAQGFSISKSRFMAPLGQTGLKLVHVEQSGKIKSQPVYYVFNNDDSFIIVSGDDRAEEILAYGEGQFDINDIPDGMRCILNEYKEQIEFLQTNPMLTVERISQDTPTLSASNGLYKIGTTLIEAQWGQGGIYSKQCVFKYHSGENKGKSVTCKTGCCPTAIAQIMYYWKYPNTSPSLKSYLTDSLDLIVPYLSSKTFKWSIMKNKYSSSDEASASADAVAFLMRSVGQAVQADYRPDATPGRLNDYVRNVMVNTYGYNTSAKAVKKENYTNNSWNNMLKNEINALRPVYYYAYDIKNDVAHAFVIDGYDANSYYHINWGWGSGYNYNWFKLGAFNYRGSEYNSRHGMIIDWHPTTYVTAAPSPIQFSQKTVGKSFTDTIHVKGYNLSGRNGLNLKLNDETGMFKISKTTIAKSVAEKGTTVIVTYSPTTADTHNATITISGSGVSNKTISLTGTSVKRDITVKPSSLTYTKVPMCSASEKSFTVTGTNLTGKLSVKLTDCTGMFSINKTSITATQAANGYTVTVTYYPTAVGIHVAYITISGGDALESKTVSLKGTCIKSTGKNEFNFYENDLIVDDTFTVVTDGLIGGDGNDESAIPPSNSLSNIDKSASKATEYAAGMNSINESPVSEDEMATGLYELASNSKIYAEGQTIIIESSVVQDAIISDISGIARSVRLQPGRNEIPVNSSGYYFVRTREKTAKLMLK